METSRGSWQAPVRWIPIGILACVAIACDPTGATEDDLGRDVPAVDPGVKDTPPEIEACVPECFLKECGDDGCGGSCGGCSYDELCTSQGTCWTPEYPCLVSCVGHCGYSCGTECGLCPQGQYCSAGDCFACPDECDSLCQPDSPLCTCRGRTCGSDGWGGTCLPGCSGGQVCDEVFGVCADPCDWPTFKAALTWGPVGRVSAPQTPADAQIVKATCFDYTGDGLGDNGLKGLAGQINGPMATLVEGVTTVILLELAGVTDFTTAAAFPLNGLVTVGPTDPSTPPTDFLVPESAYQTDICIPTIRFKDASITVGALAAGPWEFRLSLPISDGLVIDAPLLQARLKATLTDGAGTDGVAATEGVLGGVLTKQQIVTALAKLQASCDAAPAQAKPDFCNYLKVAISAMNLLFDLHQVGDGTYVAKTKDLPGDAASICLMFTLSKARVVGFEAAAVQ